MPPDPLEGAALRQLHLCPTKLIILATPLQSSNPVQSTIYRHPSYTGLVYWQYHVLWVKEKRLLVLLNLHIVTIMCQILPYL